MVNILFLGEIVGACGVAALKKGLPILKTQKEIDYTVMNVEGMTSGYGIGKQHALYLTKLGVDLGYGGEKLFYKPDFVEYMNERSGILRGINYPQTTPGKGMKYVKIKNTPFLFVALQGNSFLRQDIQNAFTCMDLFLKKAEGDGHLVVLYHAATTAEKTTMKAFLDGKASALIGTHTKVLTSDECVTSKNMAYITDTGRVGSSLSVGGFDIENEIKKQRSVIPLRSKEAWGDPRLQGVIVSFREEDGMAEKIEVIDEKVDVVKDEDE